MRILLAGATGLIGAASLRKLLAAGHTVIAPSRRPLALQHPALQVVEANPEAITMPVDAYLCALGTTIAKAGSQEAFRKIDFELVVAFAKRAKEQGAQKAIVVSSVGASATGNFYLRTKAEMEQAVAAVGFAQCSFLRPSMLLGSREESRPAEAVGQVASRIFAPLLLGPLRRYRPIAGEAVAQAMVRLLEQAVGGTHVYEYDDLIRFSQ